MNPLLLFLLSIWLLLSSSQITLAADCDAYREAFHCASQEKHPISLSFDDGPADVTVDVLDALKREHIKASFFIIASKIDCEPHQQACQAGKQSECEAEQRCQQRRNILQRAKDEGHTIGSHSYLHVKHSQLSSSTMRQYIRRSRELLAPYFTSNPPLFRLPYGDGWFNRQEHPEVLEILHQEGFEHVAWEMSAYDWRKADQQGDKILHTAINEICTKKKGVILFHDGVDTQEHVGRVFTTSHISKWLPAMKCVAEFKPLSFFKSNIAFTSP